VTDSAILSEDAAAAAIDAARKSLHLPTVRADAGPVADAAERDRLTHRAYLTELLSRRDRRAHHPTPATTHQRSEVSAHQDPRGVRRHRHPEHPRQPARDPRDLRVDRPRRAAGAAR